MSAGTRAPLPTLGLAPLDTPANAFCQAFSDALSGEFDCRHVPIAELEDWRAIARRAGKRVGGRAGDVVIMHWPTFFFRPSSRRDTLARLGRMAQARARGTRFVWVVHNLQPHDGGAMGSRLTAALFVSQLAGIVHLSEHSRGALRGAHRVMPWTQEVVTVHGAYPGPPPAPRPAALDPAANEPRLLVFGHVRPYKNIPHLLRVAREAALRGTVAGRVWDGAEARRVRDAAAGAPHVRLDLRDEALPDGELDALIADHHGVVLPYGASESVLNSGAAIHALSRARPVLVPRLGALPELAAAVPGWVQSFDPPLRADDLLAFARFAAERPADAKPDLSAYGWDRVSRDLTGFLRGL